MRKTLLLLVAVFLAGCSLLSGPRQFDSTEYGYAVNITANTTRAIHICGDATRNDFFRAYVSNANGYSILLSEYLKNKNDSVRLVPPVQNLQSMIDEVLIRGKYSKDYCVLKLTNIQASSRIIERVLGQTDNHSMCDGGIKNRYEQFTKAYMEKSISVAEYKELVGDIDTMVKIDTSSCSSTERQQQLEDIEMLKTVVPMVMSL